MEDFRDQGQKVNDDKKIKFSLATLEKVPGAMILLTVKTFDLRASPPKEGEFDRAWFRINDEDTN
jgi:hypothetical protein